MVRMSLALAVAAAAFAVPAASASAVELVKPCHGETYRYGALVWNPRTGTYTRACIEQ